MNENYIERINTVLTFIEKNLANDLSLATLSGIAYYSPFHLHRIFKAVTNETLNAYIIRKRTELSAIWLIHNKEMSVSKIRQQLGFKNDSTFSRTFKQMYGLSPTVFRKRNLGNFSKIGKEDSKIGQVHFITDEYLRNITNLKIWIAMNAKIEIKRMPERKLLYITQIGEAGIENTFNKVIAWASVTGVLERESSVICRVFHDSFKITEAGKVRMSIGILVDDDVQAHGEVSESAIEAGKNIVGRFEIAIEEFEKAWNSLFLWMNENGYKKAGRNPFEMYHNNYMEHPQKKCIVDLCIPVD